VAHILLRKSFLVPVILGAIWFDLRGALLTAAGVTVVFVPHVILQWSEFAGENANQFGELASVWVLATLAGWLVSREKDAMRQVGRAHEETLLSLVGALDEREHETRAHSQRVRAYALEIGKRMKLSADALEDLALGALLHDIGKIGVPDQILLKQGALSDEEWRAMRRHPEIGTRILRPLSFIGNAVDVVESHHEKVDGTGYPKGLSGRSIPLIARVFAVADAFDVITSRRPYHEAVTVECGMEQIIAGRGAHFDPTVVDAFASVPASRWREIRQSFEHLPGPSQ